MELIRFYSPFSYWGHKFQVINVEFLFCSAELLISSSHMVTYAVILAVCPTCFTTVNALFMFISVRTVELFCLESFRDVREQIMRDGKQVCRQRGGCVRVRVRV